MIVYLFLSKQTTVATSPNGRNGRTGPWPRTRVAQTHGLTNGRAYGWTSRTRSAKTYGPTYGTTYGRSPWTGSAKTYGLAYGSTPRSARRHETCRSAT